MTCIFASTIVFCFLLAPPASCLSARWTPQVAWTWFWDNLERMLKFQLGQLKGPEYEVCITLCRYNDGLLMKLLGFNWIKFHSGKTEESPCQDSSALWTGSSGTYRRRASPDYAEMYTGASLNKLHPGRTILSSRPHDCTSSQARRESSGVLWFVIFRPVGSPLHPTTAILTLPSCLPVTSHVVTSLHFSVSLVQFFFWK